MRTPDNPITGVLPVDKPRGITSHDVVARLRRAAGTRQVGHTGTLDPMATGLMLVCLGNATRVAEYLTGMDKTYTGRATFGAMSDTYDAEGQISDQPGRALPDSIEAIQTQMDTMRGLLTQLPPPHSAVKVAGRKLYEYARAGEEVPLKPREVFVHRFVATYWTPPVLAFEARVGSGTYIRSLAHDLGIAMGCGAYLSELRRTTTGSFSVEHAPSLEQLMEDPDLLHDSLLTVAQALPHMPKVTLMGRRVAALLHGQGFTAADVMASEGFPAAGRPALVIDERGVALAVASVATDGPEDDPAASLRFHPVKVLAKNHD